MRIFCIRKMIAVLLLALIGHAQQSVGQSPFVGGGLTGVVSDARSGRPLLNVMVSVAGLSTLTSDSGKYTIVGIPPGTLRSEFSASPVSGDPPLAVQFHDESSEGTQQVTASANGYITYMNNQVVIIPNDTITLSFSMSPVLAAGSMRIVLNWGAEPRDLDSYLRTPLIGGRQYRIYYGSRGRATDVPYDTLDRDVVSGFGPETITMYRFFDGTYQYYVHKFSGVGAITQSNAVVQVYSDTGIVRTIRIPTVGTGNYWRVCNIDGITKTITVVNQIDTTSPPGDAMMQESPTKKNPPLSIMRSTRSDTISAWFWNFGDGSTSTLRHPSHTYGQVGYFTVSLRVTSDTSQSIVTKRNFIAVGAGFQVNITSVGSQVNLSGQGPQGLVITRAMLHYRKAGKILYDSLMLSVSGRAFNGTFPDSVVTPRGIEYYVRLIGEQGSITNPGIDPENNPAVLSVRVARLESPQQFTGRVYKMISIPLELTDSSPAAQLVDDYGPYNPARWRLFRWQEARNTNVEFPSINRNFTPGNAFWLVTQSGGGFDA
ncbi:MAG: PKD domain-containing protein, partial [Bacteroidota bacterium]